MIMILRAMRALVAVWLLLTVALGQKTTVLSYLVEFEEEQRQDFLELTVSVSASKNSLQEAIAEAREKAEQIKSVEEEICRAIAKSKA